MPTINDQYNVINNIILTEQTVVPPTPPSGKQRLYVSASGLSLVNSSGCVVSAGGGVVSPATKIYLNLNFT